MSTTRTRRPRRHIAGPVRFDAQLMAEDVAEKGWTKLEFARKARVADMTVIRFLRGESQTGPTCKKLAAALGHTPARYLIRSSQEAVTQ